MVLYNVSASHLNDTFAALADPTRRAILARLASGEAGVMQLAKPFDMSEPATSQSLKGLARAGLIVRGRKAPPRPCRLRAGPLKEVVVGSEGHRRSCEQGFLHLDAYLDKLQRQEK